MGTKILKINPEMFEIKVEDRNPKAKWPMGWQVGIKS